jgi:ribose transport system permease protein
MPAEPAEAATPTRRSTLATIGPFLGLVAVIAVFALMTDSPSQYLSIRNFRIVVAQTVIVALGAIGMTMIIVSGGIDLSVGSAIALTGVVTAIGIRDGWGPLASVLAGVAAGGVIGIVNGLAITRLKVIPFIVTLGTLGVARGVAKWIADQQTVNVPETWVNDLAVTFPRHVWLIVVLKLFR